MTQPRTQWVTTGARILERHGSPWYSGAPWFTLVLFWSAMVHPGILERHGSPRCLVKPRLLIVLLVFCVVIFVLFVIVLCLVYPVLPVSLDCPFLIAPSVFSNIYFYCVLCAQCCQGLCIVHS